MKGGGQPSAALTVGSRAVGKRKTLDEMLRPQLMVIRSAVERTLTGYNPESQI
jgi:hypothetical protein